MPGRPAGSPVAILVSSRGSFGGNYVASVLCARGITVIGPVPDARRVLEVVDDTAQRTAVIAQIDEPAAQHLLAAELRRRGIAVLTLAGSPTRGPAMDEEPILIPPFAAYQVADWVVENLNAAVLS